MTAASEHYWDRLGQHGPWWIPDEAPGGLGGPELWIDAAALEMYACGDAAPAVTVSFPPDRTGISLLRAVIRFARHGGDLDAPAVYQVISRRWSQHNQGRPYYICRWPD